jgi:hypothetical protein
MLKIVYFFTPGNFLQGTTTGRLATQHEKQLMEHYLN